MMNNIDTTARSAMKLALEALVAMSPSGPTGSLIWHQQMYAITALRVALASQGEALASEAIEQPAPVAKPHEQEPEMNADISYIMSCSDDEFERVTGIRLPEEAWERWSNNMDKRKDELLALFEKASQPAQYFDEVMYDGSSTTEALKRFQENVQPAQRKPLTDEEIENIANSNLCIYSFARAIEANLKEKNSD